jgi:hypothetical protein
MAVLPLILGLCASALPQSTPRVEVLHAAVPGWNTEVPGHPGLNFRTSGSSFFRLRVAPNGRYAIHAITDGTPYEVIIRDGQYVIGRGDPAPWAPGETLSFIDTIDLSSDGTLALSCRAAGGSYADDAHLAVLDGSGWTAEYTESDPVTSLSGVGHGGAFSNPGVLANGTLAFTNDDLVGAGFGKDNAAFVNDQVVIQIGVDIPQGQLNGGTTAWGGFHQLDGLRFNPQGTQWISRGWLWNNGSAGTEIVAVDNQVKVQAGHVLPNSPFAQTVLTTNFVNMGDDGSWWAAGTNANGREFWVVRDGNLVTRSGLPVVTGSALTWTYNPSGWFTGAGSAADGQSYIAGNYDSAGIGRAALVMNDEIIFKEFDLMDLDGDGLFTENVEFRGIRGFGGDAGIDNLGRLTAILYVRDLNTYSSGQIVARITPGGPGLTLSNLVAGQVASIQLRDGSLGQVSRVAFSLAGPGPTLLNTPFGEVLLSLGAPWKETGTKPIDAQGEANWTQAIPAALSGASVWAQAAVYGLAGLRLSNAVATTIQ